MKEDADLLSRYHKEHSEAALAEFVRRHVDLVYCAALRRLSGNAHQAAEVTQLVFVTVSRRAEALSSHGNLVAWLHTATRHAALDLIKKEQRRLRHESEAAAMSIHDLDTDTSGPEELARLRVVLDGLLDKLPARDREALLLRHFEGRELEEIARGQGISTDAARMRVSRALARLREALERRGLKSSAATLLSALAAEASVRAPAGVAGQVTAACAAGASGLGLGLVACGILFMNTLKGVLLAGLCLALFSGGWAAWEYRKREQVAADLLVLGQGSQTPSAERARLEERSGAAQRKIAEAGKDLETLRALAANKAVEPEEEIITDTMVETRFARAGELARQGKYKEALAEYLWCLDIGMVKIPSYSGVRVSFLLGEMMQLAEKYPEARAELIRRRDKELAEVLAKRETIADDLIAFNRALGDQDKTLPLYDSLAADDSRRKTFRALSYELFAAAGRYAEAVEGHSFSDMVFAYETGVESIARHAERPEWFLREERAYMSKKVAGYVEMLAGSGDIANARMMAERLLKDPLSAEDRARIQAAFIKAGHPELAQSYQAP